MRRFVVFGFILMSCTKVENQRIQRPFDNGHGWDIRLAVPGEPGNDYPVLNSIPRTSFTCSGKEPGYYADTETNCQVFRVCTLGTTYGFQSFLCPNGTLFNQAVFVCDWWMQVNCQKSLELINRNNEKFGNLKLGSQFMSDIKKMITHPMRNPYDKIYSKNNVVVMQEYKPPSGQLYSGNFYRNSQNSENSFNQNTPQYNQGNSFRDIFSNSDISFAASTPTNQFIQHHNTFNNQKRTFPYSQLNKAETLPNTNSALISNAHGGQSSQNNKQYTTFDRSPNFSPMNSHFHNNRNSNTGKQTTYTINYSKQQLNQHIKQEKQLYTPGPTQARFSKDIPSHVDTETKQNLVSNETQPRITQPRITKTLAFRKIVKDPKSGTPRSRITFKTWIVRPSKNSKSTAVTTPIPYTENTNFTTNFNPDSTSNTSFPVKPSSHSHRNNIDHDSYKYSPLRIYNRQISATKEVPDSQVSSTSPFTSYKYPIPTKASPLYLVPTTFKPSPVEYIPPINKAKQISRQYLLPNADYEQLVPVSSTPVPLFKAPLVETKFEPKLSINKQSRINTNNNNVTFSDILTKEKLDITVSDIVKDTNKILENDSTEIIKQYEKSTALLNYPVDNYLPPNPETDQQSDEKLILQPPPSLPKSSRLIATLSPNLEPPFETSDINETFSKVSNSPYLKEPRIPANTIERTVSLKITIPVNIAEYLFKKHDKNDLYNLEILNTPSNSYLVLANNLTEDSGSNFIPIGKLIQNNISNISDSQDLVFSLLADSINTAKEYNNVAQQSIAKPTSSQLQKYELGKTSKDTSISTSQHPIPIPSYLETKAEQTIPKTQAGNINYLSRFNQQQSLQSTPHSIIATPNKGQLYTNEYIKNSNSNLPANSNKIYSGQLYQLPVPDMTKQIYNSPNPSISNYILSNSFLPLYSPQKNSEAEVEIIPSQIIPTPSLQTEFNEKDKVIDQGRSPNVFIDDFQIPTNGISAQINDNIVGTIPHPEDNDKLIQYKKDQSYYFYSHLNNYKNDDLNKLNLSNKLFLLSNVSEPTFQLIPSLGYKLDNENEKQKLLNAFQIDEYGNPKNSKQNENINFNRRQDISSDVDYTVIHPTSSSKNQKFSNFNILYNGPTSYSAPQASVGSLEANQNIIKDSYLNSRLEKFDDFDKDYGYPKITPAKKFTF